MKTTLCLLITAVFTLPAIAVQQEKGDARNGKRLLITPGYNTNYTPTKQEKLDAECYVLQSNIQKNVDSISSSLNKAYPKFGSDIEKLAINVYNKRVGDNAQLIDNLTNATTVKLKSFKEKCSPHTPEINNLNFDYLEFNYEYSVFKSRIEHEIDPEKLKSWKEECSFIESTYLKLSTEIDQQKQEAQLANNQIKTLKQKGYSTSAIQSNLDVDMLAIAIASNTLEDLGKARVTFECWKLGM